MAILGYFEFLLAFMCSLLFSFLGTVDGLPRNWPLIGMLPGLLLHFRQIHDYCVGILGRAGGTMVIKGPWFADMDMLVTVDPANVHYIMSSNFSNFPKGPQFLKMFDVLGDGIFNSDADLWLNQRKFARVQLNHHRFHRFFVRTSQDMVEKGLILVLEHFAKLGKMVDLQDLFQRLTFDSTCTLVTGYNPGCLLVELPEVPFSKAMDDAEEAIFIRHLLPEWVWKFQRWLGIGQEKKLSEAGKTLDHVIYKYVSMKKYELSKEKVPEEEEGVDLLTAYLKEDCDMEGLKSDDKFLRDMILNFMIAGRDTTSSALTWFIWLVSTHPEVETKIREELNEAIPTRESNKWRLFSVLEVSNLVYLHSAICETLRLYPPVPFQHKEPINEDTLPSGHVINLIDNSNVLSLGEHNN